MVDEQDELPDDKSAVELKKIHDALLRLLDILAERVARGLPKNTNEKGA